MGQGQLRVIIYINFLELENILLHAKFHDHRTIGSVGEDFLKVFTINKYGDHLCHVACTIYISFLSIMIASPCNVYPLTPHFYIVKLGFTGVYIIFLFLL